MFHFFPTSTEAHIPPQSPILFSFDSHERWQRIRHFFKLLTSIRDTSTDDDCCTILKWIDSNSQNHLLAVLEEFDSNIATPAPDETKKLNLLMFKYHLLMYAVSTRQPGAIRGLTTSINAQVANQAPAEKKAMPGDTKHHRAETKVPAKAASYVIANAATKLLTAAERWAVLNMPTRQDQVVQLYKYFKTQTDMDEIDNILDSSIKQLNSVDTATVTASAAAALPPAAPGAAFTSTNIKK